MTATATWLLILFGIGIGAIAAGLLAERRHRLLSRRLSDYRSALVALTNAVQDSDQALNFTRRMEMAMDRAREVLG